MNICNENQTLLTKFETGQLEQHRQCTAGAHSGWKWTHSCLFIKSKLYTHNLSSYGLLSKQNPSVLRKFILHEQVTMYLKEGEK